jgi:hypothetical protein
VARVNDELKDIGQDKGDLVVVPYFLHFWYVTKHQNSAVRAAGGLPAWGEPVLTGAGAPAAGPFGGEA